MKIRGVSTHLLRSPYSYGLDALSRAAAAANSAGAANDACPSATGSTSTALASGSAVAASAVTHGTAIAAPTHQMPATMNCLLVRVETDTGLVGWGDGALLKETTVGGTQNDHQIG